MSNDYPNEDTRPDQMPISDKGFSRLEYDHAMAKAAYEGSLNNNTMTTIQKYDALRRYTELDGMLAIHKYRRERASGNPDATIDDKKTVNKLVMTDLDKKWMREVINQITDKPESQESLLKQAIFAIESGEFSVDKKTGKKMMVKDAIRIVGYLMLNDKWSRPKNFK